MTNTAEIEKKAESIEGVVFADPEQQYYVYPAEIRGAKLRAVKVGGSENCKGKRKVLAMIEKEIVAIDMLQIKEEYLYMHETMTQYVCEMAQSKDKLNWIWIKWIGERYIALNEFISAFINYSEGDKATEEIEWGIDRLRSSISYNEVIKEWNKWKEMTKNEQADSAKKRKTTIERNVEWAENN